MAQKQCVEKPYVQTESGTNEVAMSPQGLILEKEEARRCRMPLDALLIPFFMVLNQFSKVLSPNS